MDLIKIIQELRAERRRLDRMILQLERRQERGETPARRKAAPRRPPRAVKSRSQSAS